MGLAGEGPATQPDGWEYRVEPWTDPPDVDVINILGSHGWEAVGTQPGYVLMKRPRRPQGLRAAEASA